MECEVATSDFAIFMPAMFFGGTVVVLYAISVLRSVVANAQNVQRPQCMYSHISIENNCL